MGQGATGVIAKVESGIQGMIDQIVGLGTNKMISHIKLKKTPIFKSSKTPVVF
jgi:hypothetical protein